VGQLPPGRGNGRRRCAICARGGSRPARGSVNSSACNNKSTRVKKVARAGTLRLPARAQKRCKTVGKKFAAFRKSRWRCAEWNRGFSTRAHAGVARPAATRTRARWHGGRHGAGHAAFKIAKENRKAPQPARLAAQPRPRPRRAPAPTGGAAAGPQPGAGAHPAKSTNRNEIAARFQKSQPRQRARSRRGVIFCISNASAQHRASRLKNGKSGGRESPCAAQF
jgi:hypothetical protein